MKALPLRHIRSCAFCKNRTEEVTKKGCGRGQYRNDSGEMWMGHRCPDCYRKYAREKMRGYWDRGTIDEVKYPRIKKGRESEHVAREWFERLGASVDMTVGKGTDLKVRLPDGRALSVEVKTASKHSKNGWTVGRVLRKGEDLIVVVFNGSEVVLLSMTEHLKRCAPSGKSTVSDLYKALRSDPGFIEKRNLKYINQEDS